MAFHVTEWAQVKGFGTEEDIPGGQGVEPGVSGFRTFWFLAIMNGYALHSTTEKLPFLLTGIL